MESSRQYVMWTLTYNKTVNLWHPASRELTAQDENGKRPYRVTGNSEPACLRLTSGPQLTITTTDKALNPVTFMRRILRPFATV